MKKSLGKLNRSGLRALAIILALLMFAAGCSRPGTQDVSSDDTPVPTLTPSATQEPRSGGTLRLPMPVNASSADPLDVNTEEMLYLFSLVYDNLITVGPSGELEPCLCESWSNEFTGTWLLHLREGVQWHDGSAFKAQDVIYTYNSLLSMESSYYKPCLKHIQSFEMVDEHTLRVRLDMGGLIGLYSLVFPIKKGGALNGTGAYRLDHIGDEQIVLSANENWWDKPPYIERIVFSEKDSNSTALASYEAGQLDMVPTDIITAGKYSEAGKTNVCDIMTQNMEALLFNMKRSVFSDPKLRLAVAHGINRSRIITNVYSNRARAVDVPIPPDSWLYDTRSAVLNFDAELSASLIADAGFTVVSNEDGLLYSPSGRSLRVKLLTSATTENTVRSDAASMIASQLGELGFEVEVITKPHTLGDDESEFLAALREGDWDMALVGFSLALDNDLSSYIDPEGANNFGSISDSELSARALAFTRESSEEGVRDAAFAFQSYFVENVPFLPLYFRLNSIICSAKLAGVESSRKPLLFAQEKDWYFGN